MYVQGYEDYEEEKTAEHDPCLEPPGGSDRERGSTLSPENLIRVALIPQSSLVRLSHLISDIQRNGVKKQLPAPLGEFDTGDIHTCRRSCTHWVKPK